MLVVSDTSPLRYLILVDAADVLPRLFGRVVAPPEVIAEMSQGKTAGSGPLVDCLSSLVA